VVAAQSTSRLRLARQPISLADFKTAGADLKGIFYLRNVVDADRILEAIPEAKERGGRVRPGLHVLSKALRLLAHVQIWQGFWDTVLVISWLTISRCMMRGSV